jgi:hypothetical protein
MRADFGVVLDACVLLPMPLADTLFRMAEHPRLYVPRWTAEIMEEVSRNHARHREEQLRSAFPSAWVDDGYKRALDPFGVTCKGPSSFLRDLYDLEPSVAIRKLVEQAEFLGISLEDLLERMKRSVPGFVEFLCEELRIELP